MTDTSAPRSPRQRTLTAPFTTGFLFTFGALAAIVLGLAIRDVAAVIVYVVFALFIALGLEPLVIRLMKRSLSRTWAVAITLTAVTAVIAGVLWALIPTIAWQITHFAQSIPELIRTFQSSDFYLALEQHFDDGASSVLHEIQVFFSDPEKIAAMGGGVLQAGASVINATTGVMITLVLTIYFVIALPRMKEAGYSLAPARVRPRLASLTDQISASTGAYVGGMVLLAAFNGAFVGVIHLVLGLPFPLLMGVAAMCITLIPLIGSVLFWTVASVLALLTSPVSAVIFAVAYFLYMQVEAYVITPRVMNRAVAIPAPLVVISAVAGGSLLGLLGAFIAIPITAAIVLIITQVWVPRQNAKTA